MISHDRPKVLSTSVLNSTMGSSKTPLKIRSVQNRDTRDARIFNRKIHETSPCRKRARIARPEREKKLFAKHIFELGQHTRTYEQRAKSLKKRWCCVGGKYNEMIGSYQLG